MFCEGSAVSMLPAPQIACFIQDLHVQVCTFSRSHRSRSTILPGQDCTGRVWRASIAVWVSILIRLPWWGQTQLTSFPSRWTVVWPGMRKHPASELVIGMLQDFSAHGQRSAEVVREFYLPPVILPLPDFCLFKLVLIWLNSRVHAGRSFRGNFHGTEAVQSCRPSQVTTIGMS